jgi:hypothetical protein
MSAYESAKHDHDPEMKAFKLPLMFASLFEDKPYPELKKE